MKQKINFKQIFLISMITFFVISGIVGATFFLTGSFGDTQRKILLTSLTLGVFSLIGLANQGRIESKDMIKKILGFIGLFSAAISAVLITLMIWDQIRINETNGKIIWVTCVLAISIAHAFLMMGEAKKVFTKVAMYTTLSIIAVMAILLIYIVLADKYWPDMWRLLGFVGVLDAAGTIVTPLARKLGEKRRR